MADFRINVIVDPGRVPQGTRPVERQLTRLENRASRLRRTLGLTFTALAGGAVIFGAIRNMAKFEESIAVVRAVTKATVNEFDILRARAQQLGITTRFSATQAADAMVLLARAGFSVQETMQAVGQTLLLAQAGGLQMAEAADITASSLRGFALAASDTARVTDVLTETANSSNTNVSQLGQALKFVAPIAKGLGQSIEITNAALGALSDAGLKGTLAGTGLRRVLAELASPGRELADILEAAGLQIADVDPKVVGLTQALEELKLAGFDTGDALEVFGQRGGPAFAVLVDNIPKIRALEQALFDAGGESKRVAGIMDRTLNGALFRLKSALEGVNLAIGEALLSPVLVTFFDALTATLRFVARNADLLRTALIALAIGGVTKLAIVLSTTLQSALKGAAISMGLLRVSAIKTIAVMNVGPFLAVTAAVIPLAFAINRYNNNLIELGKTLDRTEEDSKQVAGIFAQLTATQRELNRMTQRTTIGIVGQNDEILKQDKLSKAQLARKKLLEDREKATRAAIEESTAAQKEANARARRGAEIVEAAIKRLERRREALAALTLEEKARVAFQAELDRLDVQQALPSQEEKEKIRNLIETNTELAVQQKIFEEIVGPLRTFKQESRAVQILLEKEAISAEQAAVKLQELKDALAPTEVEDPTTALDSLIVENQLLQARIRHGDEFADALSLEHQMRLAGVEVNDTIREQIAAEIARRNQLRGVLQEQADIEAQLARDARQEERQLDRLERRIKSQQALNDELDRLRTLFDQGRLSAEELSVAIEDVQLKGLEASNTLEDGFTRAFIKLKREAEDLAAVGEQVVNVFADNFTDALTKLAEEGKLSFKDLARSILQDLTRILARLLVVQAITAVFGPGGGPQPLGPLPFPGRQEGGPVQPNRGFVVGEDGPELFVPNRPGNVVPNQALQQPAAPPVIQVVNVQSEDDVPNVINDGGADEAIINAIARNKDRVNQVTQ